MSSFCDFSFVKVRFVLTNGSTVLFNLISPLALVIVSFCCVLNVFCNVGCIENEALVNVQGDIEIIRSFNKIISV